MATLTFKTISTETFTFSDEHNEIIKQALEDGDINDQGDLTDFLNELNIDFENDYHEIDETSLIDINYEVIY